MNIPSDYIDENTKLIVQSTATCGEVIYLEKYCVNNQEHLELEESVVNLVVKHHLECNKCIYIKKRKEEYELQNSTIRCESNARCGEKIYRDIPYTKDKTSLMMLENSVVNTLYHHQLDCPYCQTIINRINLISERKEKIKKIENI